MKTKKIKVRQGFTIVELVIVIGVIGVLTAVLVPTFINLNKKAEEASNQAFVKNLNTQMAIREQEEGKNNTMFEAVEDAKQIGFDVEKLTPVNGNDLVWDSVANRFALVNGEKTIYADGQLKGEGQQLWKIYDKMPSAAEQEKFSIYARGKWGESVNDLKTGFDAGYNTGITQITYKGSASHKALIRGYGEQCVVTINAANDDVDFYGFAKKIDVQDVKGESLHIYGSVADLEVTKGHVAVEDTGIVFTLNKLEETGKVTNNGYIAEKAESVTKAVAGKALGGDYKIGSLAQFEAFRDTVNAGNDFAGINVVLTSDITLHDGWKPIGEGSREIAENATAASGTFFEGTFDGNNHTVSNLNNKGFVPTGNRLAKDGEQLTYAYGLFALVNGKATIKNLKIKDVDIDTLTRYAGAKGDSVGALVGFSAGSLTVENVEVANGKIVAADAAAGILGRAYATSDIEGGHIIAISNSKNAASMEVSAKGGKAAGILAIASDRKENRAFKITVDSCSNSAEIKATNAEEAYASGVWAYVTKKNSANVYKVNSCSNTGSTSAKTFGSIIAFGADKVIVSE